jgi:hypothetical protein
MHWSLGTHRLKNISENAGGENPEERKTIVKTWMSRFEFVEKWPRMLTVLAATTEDQLAKMDKNAW